LFEWGVGVDGAFWDLALDENPPERGAVAEDRSGSSPEGRRESVRSLPVDDHDAEEEIMEARVSVRPLPVDDHDDEEEILEARVSVPVKPLSRGASVGLSRAPSSTDASTRPLPIDDRDDDRSEERRVGKEG